MVLEINLRKKFHPVMGKLMSFNDQKVLLDFQILCKVLC